MARLSFFVRREFPSLMLAAVLVLVLLNAIFGAMNPRDLLTLRQHRAMLEGRSAELSARNQALRTNVQLLAGDDAYLQHLIRRELGFARPDEVIYRFAPDSAASSR